MHILHAVQLYRPVPSGAARYFVEVGERLVREGHRVTTIATDAFDLEHLWLSGRKHIESHTDTHNGVEVVRFPVKRVPGPALLYPVLRRLMVEISRLPAKNHLTIPLLYRLATLTPQVPGLLPTLESTDLADVALVHTTNITLDFFLVPILQWAERRAIPHICTPFVHLGEPDNRSILRYYAMPHQIDLLRRCRAVIAQTGREKTFLRQTGVPASSLCTVGVGVAPEELAGGDGERFRREHRINGPLVLTIGVAAYDKGTIHVVEAIQQLWARERQRGEASGDEATWVQIGPQMEHFQQFCQRLPPHDRARMRILGFVDDQTKRDALAAADVFVLPSRTDSFGIVYLEAWLYRVPVIGAWAGGVPDVVTHGTNGLLVPFGAVGELSHAIERLLHEREYARTLGEQGYTTVVEEMTWDRKYAQVRAVYTACGLRSG